MTILAERIDLLVHGVLKNVYVPGITEDVRRETAKQIGWIVERKLEDQIREAVNEKFAGLTVSQIVEIALSVRTVK
jgi:hypothetical protein